MGDLSLMKRNGDLANLNEGIEIVNLNDEDLTCLAKKTKVMIATVGPYSLYGAHAFRACAENGTHYLDVTGEVPWVAEMIKKYEGVAKKTGAIMIPQIGLESAPADLITWMLVKMVREKFKVGTKEVVLSVHELKYAFFFSFVSWISREDGFGELMEFG